MKTKYINEYTNESFETEKEAKASEKKYLDAQEIKKKKDSERAARAKEVDEAMKAMLKARKQYMEVLKAFCKDYNSYHFSTNDLKGANLIDLLDIFEW